MKIKKTSNLFVLEGNMGSGKSTFLKIIESNLGYKTIQEPASEWQNIDGSGNILDLFYKNPSRWAYTFQLYAFTNRLETIIEQSKNPETVQILERSIFCDRFCFAKNCYEMGFMSDLEWKLYTNSFSWLVESFSQKPKGFIYLRTNPETSMQRVRKRSRPEEKNIDLPYLKLLHKKHEEWLIDQKETPIFLKNVPILVLDCNSEFENNLENQKIQLSKVKNFIEKTVLNNFVQFENDQKQNLTTL